MVSGYCAQIFGSGESGAGVCPAFSLFASVSHCLKHWAGLISAATIMCLGLFIVRVQTLHLFFFQWLVARSNLSHCEAKYPKCQWLIDRCTPVISVLWKGEAGGMQI